MFLYVCTWCNQRVCMCVIRSSVFLCVCVYIYIYIYAHKHYIYIYIYICVISSSVFLCIYSHTTTIYLYLYIYIYIYIYIYAHKITQTQLLYIYIYTYMYTKLHKHNVYFVQEKVEYEVVLYFFQYVQWKGVCVSVGLICMYGDKECVYDACWCALQRSKYTYLVVLCACHTYISPIKSWPINADVLAEKEIDFDWDGYDPAQAVLKAAEDAVRWFNVCMNACMYVCMHVSEWEKMQSGDSMYVCMHACMYACMYVNERRCTPVIQCMYECMYVCMHVCEWDTEIKRMQSGDPMCVWMHACMYVCMYVMQSGDSMCENVNKCTIRCQKHRHSTQHVLLMSGRTGDRTQFRTLIKSMEAVNGTGIDCNDFFHSQTPLHMAVLAGQTVREKLYIFHTCMFSCVYWSTWALDAHGCFGWPDSAWKM